MIALLLVVVPRCRELVNFILLNAAFVAKSIRFLLITATTVWKVAPGMITWSEKKEMIPTYSIEEMGMTLSESELLMGLTQEMPSLLERASV